MIVIDQGGEWLWQKVQNVPNSLKRMQYSIAWIILSCPSQDCGESWSQRICTEKLDESSNGT